MSRLFCSFRKFYFCICDNSYGEDDMLVLGSRNVEKGGFVEVFWF